MGSKPEGQASTLSRRDFVKGIVAAGTVVAVDHIASKVNFGSTNGVNAAKEGSHSLLSPEFVHAQTAAEIQLLRDKGEEYGRFFTQTGDGQVTGFAVANYENGPQFWTAFNRLGGVGTLGYPISAPLEKEGFKYQLFQGGALQVNPSQGSADGIVLANTLDELSKIEEQNPGFAQQLRNEGVPAHKEGENISPEERLTWIDPRIYESAQDKEAVAEIRNAFITIGDRKVGLDEAAQIKGYPTSKLENRGLFSGVRFQRVALQYWQETVPGHPELPQPGSVTSFLSGDLLRRGGWVNDKNALLAKRYDLVVFQQPEPKATFPKEIGNLKTDGIVIHNMGTKIGLSVGDQEMFNQIFPPLAKKYRPNGIEWFVYDQQAKAPDGKPTIGPAPAYDLLKKGYQQYETHLGAYPGTFLQDSTLLIGQRADGVTEVHIGLFPKPDTNPTLTDTREVSFTLNTKILTTTTDEENIRNSDVFEAHSSLVDRRVWEKNLPMPLIVILV